MNDKLTELLDELVTSKTFSLDAVSLVQQMKTEVQRLQAENREQFERLQRKSAEELRLVEQLEATKSEVSKLRVSLDESKKEAHALRDLGQQGKEAKAELKGFTEAMQMVFKPGVVRESFQKTVPVGVPGGHGGAGWVARESETGTVERSQE